MTAPRSHIDDRRIWPEQSGPDLNTRLHAASLSMRRLIARTFRSGTITTDDGVRYTPIGHHSLSRAMSKRGPGYKDYAVDFQDGQSCRIRVTPHRIFADLTGPRLAVEQHLLEGQIRPGSRALILNAGTGDTTRWLAAKVGPTGSVVALERDEPSVQFARTRHRLEGVAHEIGHMDQLVGEPDQAFEFVLMPRDPDPRAKPPDLEALWRLVSPGGSFAISLHNDSPLVPGLARAVSSVIEDSATINITTLRGITLAIAHRPTRLPHA